MQQFMTTSINRLKKIALILCPAVLLFSSGCKKFLNVNQDPNNLPAAHPAQLLPTVEVALGVTLGDDYYSFGNIWAQYFTQSAIASQYKSIDAYLQVNADFNYGWQHLYQSALINTQLMIENSAGNSTQIPQVQYMAIGYVLKAYALQLGTDAFGDIPMNEALQGLANKNPTYDPQETVYDTIFSLLHQGKALMNNSDPTNPGAADVIFQGNMNNWVAFANTLELRAWLRLSQINPAKAQAGVQALYTSGANFLTSNAQITYSATGGNQNPFYIKEVSLNYAQNMAASQTVISAFVRNNDPRQFALFDTAGSASPGQTLPDTVAYLPQGASIFFNNKPTSPPSALVAGNAQDPNSALAPVFLISQSESYFLQAEAIARGWAPGGSAAASSLFTQGITASFTADGIPAAAPAYIASAPDAVFPPAAADQIKAIITQKYYAMCGSQGFEAWTEWRRTGYPNFFVPSASSGGRTFPQRFLYPLTEVTANLHYPGTVPETTPVWWQ
jgi:SusD/RagB-like outer membrane lipoprotein